MKKLRLAISQCHDIHNHKIYIFYYKIMTCKYVCFCSALYRREHKYNTKKTTDRKKKNSKPVRDNQFSIWRQKSYCPLVPGM